MVDFEKYSEIEQISNSIEEIRKLYTLLEESVKIIKEKRKSKETLYNDEYPSNDLSSILKYSSSELEPYLTKWAKAELGPDLEFFDVLEVNEVVPKSFSIFKQHDLPDLKKQLKKDLKETTNEDEITKLRKIELKISVIENEEVIKEDRLFYYNIYKNPR